MRPYQRSNREYESNIGVFRVAMGLSVAELSRACETDQSTISSLNNGMALPFYVKAGKAGEIKPYVKKMCKVLHASLEDLFPRYVCDIDRNTKPKDKYVFEQAECVANGQFSMEHSDNKVGEQLALRRELDRVLATLPEREEEILVLRFFNGMTLKEVAARFGLTSQAISSIEFTALQRLGHKSRSRHIKEFICWRKTK